MTLSVPCPIQNARQSKDADILVSPDQSSKVIQVLNGKGYIYQSHAVGKKCLSWLVKIRPFSPFNDLTLLDAIFVGAHRIVS
jgi:hypothetical protein